MIPTSPLLIEIPLIVSYCVGDGEAFRLLSSLIRRYSLSNSAQTFLISVVMCMVSHVFSGTLSSSLMVQREVNMKCIKPDSSNLSVTLLTHISFYPLPSLSSPPPPLCVTSLFSVIFLSYLYLLFSRPRVLGLSSVVTVVIGIYLGVVTHLSLSVSSVSSRP